MESEAMSFGIGLAALLAWADSLVTVETATSAAKGLHSAFGSKSSADALRIVEALEKCIVKLSSEVITNGWGLNQSSRVKLL